MLIPIPNPKALPKPRFWLSLNRANIWIKVIIKGIKGVRIGANISNK